MAQGDLTCDVHIIGGGPAGYTAAIYAARAGLETVVSTPAALSGMMAMAPSVGNWPGQIEPAPGREILERIHQQAVHVGAEVVVESVAGVNFSEDRGLQIFGGAQLHVAQAVIVATGAWNPSDKVPGEDELLGRGVAYCVACDGPLFEGEDVIVAGCDAHAAEEALALSEIASSVVMTAPTPKLPFDDQLIGALEAAENVEVRTCLRLQEVIGEEEVEGALFKDSSGDEVTVEATGIFMYLRGNSPATEFLMGSVDLDEDGYIITNEMMETSFPGVYAAGDVRKKQVNQQVVAAGEGATAALAAERYIRGGSVRSQRGAAAE
jgi:thioredoxin reductase (NADPH)